MELNRVFIYLVLCWSAAILVRMFRHWPRVYRGWLFVACVVPSATGAAWVVWPSGAGFLGFGLWLVTYLAPVLGSRALNRMIMNRRLGAAHALARVLRLLHPADGWWEQPELIRALRIAGRGNVEEATAILSRHGSSRTPVGRAAAMQLLRISQRWEDIRDWLGAEAAHEGARLDAASAGTYVRALGETGDPNAMTAAFVALRPSIERGGADSRATARLVVAAFAGRVELLERLLDGPLAFLSEDAKEFWRATAEFASGRPDEARSRLERARVSADALSAASIDRRLSRPPAEAAPLLSAGSREALERVEREIDLEERYAGRRRGAAGRPYACYAIVALNCLVFAAELALEGIRNPAVLFAMGAFAPRSTPGSEWWRVLASLHLHFDPMHLALNMMGVLILGPFVEVSFGIARYAAVYFLSGVGGMLIFAGVASLTPGFSVVLGASGCVMGLVGATGAILLRGWREERSRIARKRLAWVGTIVAMQLVFDVMTPEVSVSAHFGGLVVGFLTGLVLWRRPEGEPGPPAASPVARREGDAGAS